jgi:hypothetical protein
MHSTAGVNGVAMNLNKMSPEKMASATMRNPVRSVHQRYVAVRKPE